MTAVSEPGRPIPSTLQSERPSRLARFVAEHRRNRVVRKLARVCRRYLDWYGNLSYDLQSNGESFVLRALSRFQPRVLFDVGANVGEWTFLANAICPTAEVHSFEIAPPTFQRLVSNTKGLPGIRVVNLGLSDTEGSIRIRHYGDMPALTTSSDYPHPFPSTEIMANVTTGDRYAAANGVTHIDLLKIDVEGMEQNVLRGFAGMLGSGSIDVVQFEYGRVSIMNRFLLRDFHELFERFGYVVGKIFPNYVDFRPYDLEDEDFVGPNYLACRSAKSDYVQGLGARG